MSEILNYDQMYSDYFKNESSEKVLEVETDSQVGLEIIQNNNNSEKKYTYDNIENGIPIESTFDYGSKSHHWLAEDNISTIDQLGEVIKKLVDTAWGKDWGQFGSEFKENTNERIDITTNNI